MDNRNTSLLEKDEFDLSDIFTPEELAEIERAALAELAIEEAPVEVCEESAYAQPLPAEEPFPVQQPEEPAKEVYEAKPAPWKKSIGRGIASVAGKVISFVLATVVLIVAFAFGVVYLMSRGPSDSARDLFVLSLRETSAAGFVTEIFLSDEEISIIEEANKASDNLDSVDTSLITIATKEKTDGDGDTQESEVKDLEILDVTGATFNGKMMIVADPERVIVGVSNQLGVVGQTLPSMIESYGGVGGVNAGGFDDPNGNGNGGIPLGIVIHEGQLLSGANTRAATAVIDYDGILHVGNMTGNEAMALNAEWAVSFGPVLVVNGEKCDGLSSGLNPRTAIGQRADGAILLLVVNGRQVGSMGATYEDLADVMISYGAVNALNLDGGSSSSMIYQGEYLNISSSLVGERPLPTGIIIK